jgi:hypothetical protein
MEWEGESFSNRRGSRKILPENNALNALPACSFFADWVRSRLVWGAVRTGRSSGIVPK